MKKSMAVLVILGLPAVCAVVFLGYIAEKQSQLNETATKILKSQSKINSTPNPPTESYDPSRTFVVDSNLSNGNYLIRGNQPLNPDGTFAYDAMNTALKAKIGGTFDLTQKTLINISLIDNQPSSNRGDLQDEFIAFGQTDSFFAVTISPGVWPPYKLGLIPVTTLIGTSVAGHPGSLVWYPCQGCTDNLNCQSVEPPLYNFSGEVDFLAQLLAGKRNTVIYYHCTHGHDRTSALTAGYLMKYKGATLKQVLTLGPPKGAKAFKHAWEVNYKALAVWYSTVSSTVK